MIKLSGRIPYKDIEKEITRVAGALNRDLKEEDNPVLLGFLTDLTCL